MRPGWRPATTQHVHLSEAAPRLTVGPGSAPDFALLCLILHVPALQVQMNAVIMEPCLPELLFCHCAFSLLDSSCVGSSAVPWRQGSMTQEVCNMWNPRLWGLQHDCQSVPATKVKPAAVVWVLEGSLLLSTPPLSTTVQ